MGEACLYNIMELPKESLRQVLPKASVKMLARLINAYPRAIGRSLLALVADSVTPLAFQFLKDHLAMGDRPTWSQVRAAESEFVKLLHDQKLFPNPAAS